MSLVINYNAASQQAQNSLRQTQSQLNQSIERLSSGKRINSAADDAAGQAIANRLTAQINGLGQAANNANDGISLAQTTEGALDQINKNIQRIRELSVQAANGTNSQSNLNSIQDEIDARFSEIDRVAEQTAFNGIGLLDGSTESIGIQVGGKDGQIIEIDLQSTDAEQLGLGSYNVNGYTGTLSSTNLSAVTPEGLTSTGGSAISLGDLSSTQITLENIAGDAATSAKLEGFSDSNVTNLSAATLEANSDGDLFAVVDASHAYAVTATEVTGASAVTVTVDTSQPLGEKTDGPLGKLDSALTQIGQIRGGLGAVQNRFDSVISTIESTKTNLASAKSRIVDTNYAEAVSQLSQAKILNQAGTAVLAQANQTQQGVLSLLRNV